MGNNELIPLLPEMAIFVVVAEEGGFSKAGRKLGLAPSSVSRSVNRLEKALHTKLLERTTRQVKMSTAGAEVYTQCKSMLESAKLAVRTVQCTQDEAVGVLRVAAPKAFAKQILSPLLLDFMAAYPKITIHFKVTDLYIDPIGEEIDVIFRLTDQPIEGLISKTLARTNLLMCASSDYLEQFGVPGHPDDLEHHQCIVLGEWAGDNEWRLTSVNQTTVVKTNNRMSVNHTEIRKEAVLRNLGIAIFPDFTVQSEVRNGTLVQILPDWHIAGNYSGEVILQYAQSRYIPYQIRLFVDYMSERFSKLSYNVITPEFE
ncbi:putative LysR family transcriptional regulator [Vibrio halioticoli NBRC 102217]|uniref:Putative LysR family transcriptional regulator n=1 Tax=Vibrio halioticoli NBRC 102217 TaxID=1219072 RepID=V5FM92_9VIBR|nr:LysR family transcriptional regulator [Vibrio halioticoli]GAD89972.1 putative LysR family transcriptional regulator [Vibrio halioticoli NBRC 102217]